MDESTSPYRLDDSQRQKIHEGRRLSKTQLAAVEDDLKATHRQMDLLARFVEVKSELDAKQQALYHINKVCAQNLEEATALERFEAFEAVNGLMQRIRLLERHCRDLREMQNRLIVPTENSARLVSDAEKSLAAEQAKEQECQQTVIHAAYAMSESSRLKAQMLAYQEFIDGLSQLQDEAAKWMTMLEQELMDVQSQLNVCNDNIQENNTVLAPMAAHQSMIEHGERILEQLDNLWQHYTRSKKLTEQLHEVTVSQKQRNELAGRILSDYQHIEAQIRSIQEEIQAHRQSVAGQESSIMQQRALELRIRHTLLVSALALWTNIAAGYERLEEKQKVINALRLKVEHLNSNIDTLTEEVRAAEVLTTQKMQRWLLNKSQNIIELRSGLEEGQTCAVCGATTHPWHSEGVLEQNALISAWKNDYETASRDLHAKEQELHALQQQLAENQGRLDVEREDYDQLQQRQQRDVTDWSRFTHLNTALAECNPSTNRMARLALLQQLVEQCSVAAVQAKTNLETFSFHLDAISRLSRDLTTLRRTQEDTLTRLNDENTACQVLAHQQETLQRQLNDTTQHLGQGYEQLEKDITLSDWYEQWKQSPETIRQRIRQYMDTWDTFTRQNNELTMRHHQLSVHQKRLQSDITQLQTITARYNAVKMQKAEQVSKLQNALTQMHQTADGQQAFQATLQQAEQQHATTQRSLATFSECIKQNLAIAAQHENLEDIIAQTEQQTVDEHRTLDLWMHQYNSSHPPVQFTELDQMLVDGKDWNEVRLRVRQDQQQQTLLQTQVDKLRATIIALQAEGMKNVTDDGDSEQKALVNQQQQLEQQRSNLLQQIAHYDMILRNDERIRNITP